MDIYRPTKSNYKSQGFGENLACAKTTSNGFPLRPFVIVSSQNGVCPVGSKPFYPLIGLTAHNGEDWATWRGEPLYFPVDSGEAGGFTSMEASDVDGGIGIDIMSNQKVTVGDYYGHIKFRFWHLQKAWKDTDVKFGELIGFCDSTGASGGDHVHWAMKFCDEFGTTINANNGYQGAVDFSPYFENVFVLDVLEVKSKALSVIELAHKLIFNVKVFLGLLKR